MRRWILASALVAASLVPLDAHAMGAVAGRDGEHVVISTSRVAVATGPSRTTRWAQVTVDGASAGFIWLVPVEPGALVDLASNAWLDALDAATTPVFLPPTALTDCEVTLGPVRLAPVSSRLSASPTLVTVALDMPSLTSFVSNAGYAIPPDVADAVAGVFPYGMAIAALVFSTGAVPTHAVRIVDQGPAALELALTGASTDGATVEAFVVAGTPEAAGDMPLLVDPSLVLWNNDGTSTYEAYRTGLLLQWQGARWLTESASPTSFFGATDVPASQPLPAVIDAYFTLAQAYGDAAVDPAQCSSDARFTSGGTVPYAEACPAGLLAAAPGESPCATTPTATTPVDGLVCGGAVDAALAVAGLAPQGVWVTRVAGLVPSGASTDVPVTPSDWPAFGPVFSAGGYSSTCAPSGDAGEGSSRSGGSSKGGGSSTPSVDLSSSDDSCGGSSDDAAGDDAGGCSGGDDADLGGGCSGGGDDCEVAAEHRHHSHHRQRSPWSRMVLVGAAIAVIARRRPRHPRR